MSFGVAFTWEANVGYSAVNSPEPKFSDRGKAYREFWREAYSIMIFFCSVVSLISLPLPAHLTLLNWWDKLSRS